MFKYKVTVYRCPAGEWDNKTPEKAKRFKSENAATEWGRETSKELWEMENSDWYDFTFDVVPM